MRIEPIPVERRRAGYGSMRGTVELLVTEDELVSSGGGGAWETLAEWGEATKS